MSLRLEQIPYEFEGKTYMLRCNMAVLEDIQDAHGGNLEEALDPDHAIHSAVEFLTAMLNDYADEMGWPERYTIKQVKRKLSFGEIATTLTSQIMGMVIRSMAPPGKPAPNIPEDNPEDTPENSGN